MSSKPKFPIHLPSVPRKPKSSAQDLAFGREELASAIRFLADQPVAGVLRQALAALPQPEVLPIGCWRCNGDVPLANPELVADGICRPCADDYDRAVADRRERMRSARSGERLAA